MASSDSGAGHDASATPQRPEVPSSGNLAVNNQGIAPASANNQATASRPAQPIEDNYMASGYTTPGLEEGVTIDHLDSARSHSNDERQPLLPPSERDPSAPVSNDDYYTRVSAALKRISQLEFTFVLSSWSVLLTMVTLGFAALFAGSFIVSKPPPARAIDNGVGKLPFMGYNTWNAYHCDINEKLVLDSAELMVSLGLKDAGYNYMNIDDCYSEKKRNFWGDIVESKERFGGGMRNLVDKIHGLGLKAGIYSDSGWFTCQLYPGSYQNEARDIKLFRETWGFDLLKYDNCAVPFDEIIKENIYGKYVRMSNAIADLAKSTGKEPILFSLCEWGRQQPWLWAKRLGQSWRTTDDIGPYWNSLASIINQNSFISWASDFYGRNDMDILEVGNGDLSYEEAKSHFTAWALMKSPLLISTDLSSVTNETLEILTNREIIAINQDPVVGTSITPFRWGINPNWTPNATHPAQYWSGESQNGTVIMLLNTLDGPADMTFQLTESPWLRAGRQYAVRDLWAHTDNGTAVRSFTAKQVPGHGVVALLLKDAGDEPKGTQPPCQVIEWCTDKNGTVLDPNNG